MKLVVLTIVLLCVSRTISGAELTKKSINDLEREIAKFLTHENDVTNMKISFDNRSAGFDVSNSNVGRKLGMVSATNPYTGEYEGSTKLRRAKQFNKRRNLTSIYDFNTSKHKSSIEPRKLLKTNKYNTKARLRSLSEDTSNPVTDKFKNLASTLGLKTTTDAMLAGMGTAAMVYGANKKYSNGAQYKKAFELLQKKYINNKWENKQIGAEISNLKQLAQLLDETNKKAESTENGINDVFKRQMMYGPDIY